LFEPVGGFNTEISAKLLALGSSSNAAVESSEGNGLFVFTDIVEVGNRLLQVHAVDCLGCLTGVFEVDTEIGAACFGRLCRVDRRC